MSWDDFDTYVLKKGYHFEENHIDEVSHSIGYSYDSKGIKGVYGIDRGVMFGQKGNSETTPDLIIVTYNTFNTQDYLTIKNQIKTNGYKLVSTENKNGGVWLRYKKGDMELTLISSKGLYTNGRESGETEYQISVKRRYGQSN